MNSIWKVTVWSLTFSIHKHSWIIIMMSLDTCIENTTCGVHRGGRRCSLKSTRGDSDKGDSIVQPVGIDCNFVSRMCRTTPWETLDKVYRERGRETSQSVGWCSRASGMETTSSTCNSLYGCFFSSPGFDNGQVVTFFHSFLEDNTVHRNFCGGLIFIGPLHPQKLNTWKFVYHK